MAKLKPADAVGKLVDVLESVDEGERDRVIQAALTLIGVAPTSPLPGMGARPSGGQLGARIGEQAYFDSKEPRTKIEELAVAAHYRETQGATTSTRDELKAVVKAARRNFDDNKFRRDLDNARTAGLFTRGTGKDSVVLSHYGQNYVVALPDRERVKALAKPKGAGARKKRGAKPPQRGRK
jgi:hypothetical protein